MRKRRGFFLTLEGTDGVGKTTHAALLKKWLSQEGLKAVLTREPGGGKAAEKIRKLILDPREKIENLTELFLYEAARIEHLSKTVLPALKAGKIVVCDRFTDATIAYQGFGRGLDLKTINTLNKIATKGLLPHLTLLLDLSPKIGLKKARKRNKDKKGDRLEKEGISFQKKVRRGYLSLLKRDPQRIKRISVQPSIEMTQRLIRNAVRKKFLK